MEVGRRVEGRLPYYFLQRKPLWENGKGGSLGGRASGRGGGSLTISCRGNLCGKTGREVVLEVGRRVEGGGSLTISCRGGRESGRKEEEADLI